MTHLILTSTGISDPAPLKFFRDLVAKNSIKRVGIIANAATDGVNGKYVLLAKQQLESLGLDVNFIDLAAQNFARDMSTVEGVYIAGGNTFNLLGDIQKDPGINEFKAFLLSMKVVLGVSAGSIILTPTIRIAGAIDPDDNHHNIKNLYALNLIDQEYYPHYEISIENMIASYEEEYATSVIRSSNGSFVHFVV